MDAFDVISEPALFIQQLCEHSGRVHQCVELIQSLADALLAEDYEQIRTLHEQMARIRAEVHQSELSLYARIKEVHFHSAGGDAFSQYLACQNKVADSSLAFAELLVLRKTAIPIELHDDFRALVTQIVNVSRRTMSLAEGLFSEVETVCPDTEAQSSLDAIRGTIDDSDQARRLEVKFARHFYSLEKQLDPVTLMFLDKYCAALHEVAGNAKCAADHLRRMIR
jgi:predicted phosphate transport protein (TIGR00153 family)